MTLKFVDFAQAQLDREAGRPVLTVVAQIPSPWSEGVKGLLELQGRDYSALRLDPRNQELHAWAGSPSAPSLMLPGKAPLTQAVEIIEALDQEELGKPLLPKDSALRAGALEMVRELVGPGGLAWSRRLLSIHAGLHGAGGFVEPIAEYLSTKYNYDDSQVPAARERMLATLRSLAERIKAQNHADSPYFFGREVSAADVYCAVCMAVFVPLDEGQCPMDPIIRTTFEERDEQILQALDPILLAHRDFIYQQHLELPVRL